MVRRGSWPLGGFATLGIISFRVRGVAQLSPEAYHYSMIPLFHAEAVHLERVRVYEVALQNARLEPLRD